MFNSCIPLFRIKLIITLLQFFSVLNYISSLLFLIYASKNLSFSRTSMLFLWLWFRFVKYLVILKKSKLKLPYQTGIAECPSNKVQQTTRCEPTLKNAVPGHQNDTRNKVGRQVTLDSYKSRFTIARRSGLWSYFARNIRSPLTASYRCSLSVRGGTSLIPTLLTQPSLDLRMLYGRLVSSLQLFFILFSSRCIAVSPVVHDTAVSFILTVKVVSSCSTCIAFIST